jgi:hypothetical protein
MKARGQTLVLVALTMLLVVVMACMTLSISTRVRRKLELQTIADTAAYNDAVSTARGLNAMGVINRTIVSHWVVMLGIEANLAWGSTVPAYFDTFADALNDMRGDEECLDPAKETRRLSELQDARDAFLHASLSVWSGGASGTDPVKFMGCSIGNCFPRLKPGLGQLDKKVAEQAEAVWRSAKDLVDVQRDIKTELRRVLEDQALDRQATLAAQGKALNAASTFPYEVHVGAATRFGITGRPPGWREVDTALGSSRAAMTPLAHAAMGSRGSRFVISNKYDRDGDPNTLGFSPFTPRRAKVYAKRIKGVLNKRWGVPGRNAPFHFVVRGNQSSSFLDDGDNKDNPAEADLDELFTYVEEPDTLDTGVDAEDAETEYEPDSARRITPARSVGLEYATSQMNGTIKIFYNSPCGYMGERRGFTASARAHTRMALPAASGHEWQQMKRSTKENSINVGDITMDYREKPLGILHGPKGADDHGYEQAFHEPNSRCHPGHRHWGEANDKIHTLEDEIEGMGLSPGGFGYLFPQNGPDPDTGEPRNGASGAFGQPKLPVLITRANTGGGIVPDPWNLTFGFQFKNGGPGQRIDLAKEADTTPITALATGIAYYHRRCESYSPVFRPGLRGTRPACVSWNEAPNMLNPFWRATLVPIDVDETMGGIDQTPGNRIIDEAPSMLESAGLNDAALTYRLLKWYGYKGIQ